MVRLVRFALLILGIGCLPLVVEAQQAKTPKVEPDKIRAKLLMGTTIDGTFTKIDEGENRFSFQHGYPVKTPNPEAQKKLALLMAQFNAALKIRSTALEDLKKLQTEGMAAEKAAFTVEEVPIPFEFKADNKLVIRTMLPPVGPDGKPKKLTAAEEKKLKGDPKYPGYQATLKDLDKKLVRVTLDKTKPKPPAGTDPKDAVYSINLIIIIPEPQPTTAFKIPGE